MQLAPRPLRSSIPHVPHLELSPIETRVLGCLLEKERLTPENYPISLNALTAACNQSTNREPVSSWSEREVDDALTTLREKKLAIMIHSAGSRVQKYRHNLSQHYELQETETALLCVLMLRGPQTLGELRIRTERFHSFGSLEEVGGGPAGAGPRRRSAGAPSSRAARPKRATLRAAPFPASRARESATVYEAPPARSSRVEMLEQEIAGLRTDLQALREQFEKFRQQFE